MSGLRNLKTRLQYFGGDSEGRLQQDKLRSLKRALFNSYQASTVVLGDGREFKCLINPNKNSPSYDNKILSIPYKDICLNAEFRHQKSSEGMEDTNIACGDVVLWKETETYWLVFLQYLEEDSYFRAQIRRCEQQIEVNGERYWVYIRGPVETSVNWNQKAGIEWNDLNYSLVLYITKDSNTLNFFHRFQKIKILEPGSDEKKTWQVVGQDAYYGDGIVQVFLDEYFENSIEEKANQEKLLEVGNVEGIDATKPYVIGPIEVKKYDIATYYAKGFSSEGTWYLVDGDSETQTALKEGSTELVLDVMKRSGNFTLKYVTEEEEASLLVTVVVI